MKLTIIRGLPGSGKTTYANSKYRAIKLEMDMFRIKSGQYIYSHSRNKDIAKYTFNLAKQILSDGIDVVVNSTFTKNSYIQPYIELAKELNAEIEIIHLDNNFGSTLQIDDEVIQRMKHDWEKCENETIIQAPYNIHKQIKEVIIPIQED
jgi:predicted kinase